MFKQSEEKGPKEQQAIKRSRDYALGNRVRDWWQTKLALGHGNESRTWLFEELARDIEDGKLRP